MSEAIITVENLGKKYRIQHQAERQRYMTLRDVMAQKMKAPFQFFRKTTRPQSTDHGPVVGGPLSSSPRTEDFWALRDVSFSVRQGEVVGIIGRNGAGKSTLLKILSRITEPTEGRVRIRGRVASLLEVGTGFHAELTGRENIFLNGAILGMTRAEIKRKFDEIVDFSGVEKFLDTPVKRYSSGMYVRLAFAVAAHLEPEILIVDEVLAVGDAEFQKKCLGKMESVARDEGRTILFVSHNLEAVKRLTTKAIVLANGRVSFDGSTSDGIQAYLGERTGTTSWTQEVALAPRRIAGTRAAVIERVWFPSETVSFPFGEDLVIGIRLRAAEKLSNVLLNLTVFSANDAPVGTCFTAAPLEMKSGEVADVEFRLKDHGLAPGRYYLDVAAVSHNWLFDVVTGVLPFGISLPPSKSGLPANWIPGWGDVNFKPATVRRIG